MRLPLATAAFCVSLSVPVPAAAADGPETASEPSTAKGVRGWYVFPGAFYTPETQLGLAGVAGIHYGADAGLPTSSAEVIVYATQNRQYSLLLSAQLHVSDTTVIDTGIEAAIFPDFYYGVGKEAPSDAKESYTNRRVDVTFTPARRISGKLRAGPRLHLRRELEVEREDGSALAASGLPGTGTWGAAGLGVAAIWDGRDDLFQPSGGGMVEAWYVYYPEALVAGAGAFGRASLDARWFLAPLPRHVLGLQATVETGHGEVPVTILPNIGGNDTFRGYVDGRYRDRWSYSAQAEWRFPIVWRFRGTVFAGAGYVAHDAGDLSSEPFRYAGGAGVRFLLTRTGASLRVDGAYGADGLQIYFLTMEAF